MNTMIEHGNEVNVSTYKHFCDTTADMVKIDPREITLGSSCVVLEGDSGSIEVYLANSKKEWIKF